MKRQNDPVKEADHKLIMDCVWYTTSAFAGRGAYKGDPDGDAKHAERIDGDFLDKGRKSLKRAAGKKAKTMQGLRAKARAVMVALDDAGSHSVPDEEAIALCKSLAADVERMMAGMVRPQGAQPMPSLNRLASD
jgi:hypothetical protein